MNRGDPWDWSTPFKLDTQLQALTSQVSPLGGQGNAQVPAPTAPYSSPFQQAMTNRAMNAGFKEVGTQYDKAFPSVPHDSSKVPVTDAVPTTIVQPEVKAALPQAPLANTEMAASTFPTLELGSAAAEAQAL